MANVIYTIPDHLLDLAYQAWYGSPNSDLFTRNQLQRKPIPPLGLDNLALWTSDALQDLNETIAGINREKIGVEGQKLELLYFSDDEGTLQAISLQDLINSLLAPLALDGSNIGQETIYGASLRKNTLKKDNYGLQSIEVDAIKDLAVTAAKLAGDVPFSKFVKPQTASLIGGTTTNGGSWYEVTVANYQIVTKKPQNNGVTAVPLSEIWNSAPDLTFDGAKIAAASIDGSSAMKGNSTPLSTMKSTGTAASVICGRTTDQKFTEVALGNLQVISKVTNGTSPSAVNLSTIFNNEGGTPYNGSQLKDGSVPQKKINSYKQFAPFCMGSVNADMSLNKSLNVQGITKNGTGLYRIAFTTAAGDTNYICLPVVNDGSGAVARTSDKSTQAVVIRVTNMGGGNVDAGFDFEIKSW
jgi:hypothetical protein